MIELKVSSRYAKALFEVAKENNAIDIVRNDLTYIESLIKASKELKLILKSPIINKSKKKEVLDALLKGKISDLTYKFIILLADKQRETLLFDIVGQYEIIYNNEKNIQLVQITTANEINDSLKNKIINQLAEWTGKLIKANFNINKEVKGGIMIRINDLVLDATISNQLNQLRQELISGIKI